MKKFFKIILKFLIISLVFLVTTILVISSYFADDIEERVIQKVQEKLEAPLILDDVEFTIYDNFPYASVKITNLLVLESAEFDNDTLLFTECAYVEISLLNIINKIYDLQSIIITDAVINIKYNNANIPNFMIFKTENDNTKPLSINKITLLNTNFSIQKKTPILNISWALKRSIISIKDHNYTINKKGFSKKLVVGMTDYLNDKNFNFILKTRLKKDTITISESILDIENVLLNVKGIIFQGNKLDLEINANDQEINQIIKHLPANIKTACSPFLANGKITFNSCLKGIVDKENNPLFEIDYNISEGNFKLKSMPFKLNNVQINGSLSNGLGRNFNSTKIVSTLFNATTKYGNINGIFTLTNLNDYFLNSQFTSSWGLSEVNQYFEYSPFVGLRGRLDATTNYKGNIAFNNRFKKMFLSSNHKSDIKLNDVKFLYNDFPLDFVFEEVKCKLDKNKIIVKSCKATIAETDLDFNGELTNLIRYVLNESPTIFSNGNINSTYTNFSQIMTLGDLSKSGKKGGGKTIMPNWINANIAIDINNFSYENFTASNLSGAIAYNNGNFIMKDLSANTLNGSINGGFTLSEPTKNNLKLESNVKLNQINIRNSFKAFNNYGQKFITEEQLKGVGTAILNIESHWKPNFILNTKKLKVSSHLIIEKGELIDFKPLESLSSYVSLNELKHVKFSKLENSIDIANEIITIPTMKIKSSALSVFLSGTHTFNQSINYNVTLLLSELLSSSFRKENTKITEFGEEDQDGKIFNTVYFKMTGSTNDPKISLDKIRFMEDLNDSFKKEKQTINNIIEEDILQKKEKKFEEKGQEIEIEWNPKL